MSDNNHQAEPLPERHVSGRAAIAGYLLVVAIAAAMVTGSWQLARNLIVDNASSNTRAMLASVLPSTLYDNHPERDVVMLATSDKPTPDIRLLPVYRARLGTTPTAAALTMIAANGYGGPITMVVGIAADGTVLGVTILTHHETPGIGDAIERGKSDWLNQFTGRSLEKPMTDRWQLQGDGGDFDAIAGASVSSRAALSGVRQAVEYFASHKAAIFAPHAAN